MKKFKTTPSGPTVPGTPATPTDDVDVSKSGGICVAYESDYDIVIELGLDSAIDEKIGDAGKFNIAKVGPLGSCK